MKGTIYNGKTGAIISNVEASDEDAIRLQCTVNPDYKAYLGDEELSSLEWWFVNDKPERVKHMDLKITPELDQEELEVDLSGGKTLRIDNIPKGATVVYPGGVLNNVNDGYIEWEVEDVGSYYIGVFMLGYAGVKFNAIVR